MIKHADLNQILSGLRDRASDAGGSLQSWFASNPEIKQTMLRGLAGAAVGGLTTGGLAAMTPHDKEDTHAVIRPALLGAILGGGAAAGIPYGMKLLQSKIRFQGEGNKPVVSRGVDSLLSPLINNPLTAGAGITATWNAWPALAKLKAGMIDPKLTVDGKQIVQNMKAPAWHRFQQVRRAGGFWDKARNPNDYSELLQQVGKNSKIPKGVHIGRGRLYGIPAALAAGWLADRYIKGNY